MTFQDLHLRLTAYLRECVRSGAITERGLARMTGISQPHIHNVLKGKRLLSLQTADEILLRMRVDLMDLMRDDSLSEPPDKT